MFYLLHNQLNHHVKEDTEPAMLVLLMSFMICQNCWGDLTKKRNHYLSDFDWQWQHLNQIVYQFSEKRSWSWIGCVNMEERIEVQKMCGLCLRPASPAVTWRSLLALTSDHLSRVPLLRLVFLF